jgi:hypothetical protein
MINNWVTDHAAKLLALDNIAELGIVVEIHLYM